MVQRSPRRLTEADLETLARALILRDLGVDTRPEHTRPEHTHPEHTRPEDRGREDRRTGVREGGDGPAPAAGPSAGSQLLRLGTELLRRGLSPGSPPAHGRDRGDVRAPGRSSYEKEGLDQAVEGLGDRDRAVFDRVLLRLMEGAEVRAAYEAKLREPGTSPADWPPLMRYVTDAQAELPQSREHPRSLIRADVASFLPSPPEGSPPRASGEPARGRGPAPSSRATRRSPSTNRSR
ncbi:hypothetical protein [Streptomyces sp. NPDC004134]|uniref:hypothetical protein n=1 Tax=Streptomyces sp. NPDC004134 TaxID=3364691 RepID=UPI0036B32C66